MTLNQLFGLPPDCDIPPEQVGQWAILLRRLMPLLPDLQLTPEQLKIINGHLLPVGVTLVYETARALAENGARFPDVPLSPEDLTGPQARAEEWLQVREAARFIAEHADRAFRLEQAQAVWNALLAVRHVRADQHKLFFGNNDRARQRALEAAELVLSGYQDDLQGD